MGSVLWNRGCLSCNLWRSTSLQTLLTLALPPCHSRTSVVRLLTFRDHPNRASPSFSTRAIRTTYPLTSITTSSCTRPAGGTRSRPGFRCTRPAAGCGAKGADGATTQQSAGRSDRVRPPLRHVPNAVRDLHPIRVLYEVARWSSVRGSAHPRVWQCRLGCALVPVVRAARVDNSKDGPRWGSHRTLGIDYLDSSPS